ncbi:hypothetical protein RKD37_000921 [Streptomyces ambofaciens]
MLVEGVVEVGGGHDGDGAALQVDVGDFELVELGHGAAGGGDEGGGGGADGGGGVGAGGPSYGEGAQQLVGLFRLRAVAVSGGGVGPVQVGRVRWSTKALLVWMRARWESYAAAAGPVRVLRRRVSSASAASSQESARSFQGCFRPIGEGVDHAIRPVPVSTFDQETPGCGIGTFKIRDFAPLIQYARLPKRMGSR